MTPTTKLRALAALLVLMLGATAALAGDAYLGISMSDISRSVARALDLEEGKGVLVDEVIAESPADEGGLRSGDVILAVGDMEIGGSKQLAKAIGARSPGDKVEIRVLRGGKKKSLDITLGERDKTSMRVFSDQAGGKSVWTWVPDTDDDIRAWIGGDGERRIVIEGLEALGERGFLGVVPEAVGASDAGRNKLDEPRGVLVAEVVGDGPAKAAGMKSGDIIVTIDGEDIADPAALHVFMTDTEPGQQVTVGIVRDGKAQDIAVELGETPGKMALGDVFISKWAEDGTFPHAVVAPEVHVQIEREIEDVAELKTELEMLKQELAELRKQMEQKK
jgi:serine protease Do